MAKNIELLKRLRTRFLRMRHPAHFDMDAFAQKNSCGTAMCIAGHALALEGYKVRFNRFDEDDWFSPEGRKVDPFSTAARLLGLRTRTPRYLDRSEAENLFYDFSLKTPKQAAKRIEQIIAEAEGK